MSMFAGWLAAAPADAAIEIAPEAISAAALGGRGAESAVRAFATRPLPPGALAASLTSPNVVDRKAVLAALRETMDALGVPVRRVAVLVPDVAARVALVRFDRAPARGEDLEQLVRWQLKKSAPFPIDEAVLTLTGTRTAEGAGEFVAVLARRTGIRDYETLCEEFGMHAGLVDLSTFGALNLLLLSPSAAAGDWLVVYVRPEYTSIAIMRQSAMIFFRTVPGGDETLADAVHQTTMYYQDRLAGQGFGQVFLGGVGRTPGSLETARQGLEQRLAMAVRPVDVSRAATLAEPNRQPAPERLAALAPLVGTLLRMRAREAA